jgi:hypothetical protein
VVREVREVREARVSGWGSVCERGVEGLREVMLSVEVLLSPMACVGGLVAVGAADMDFGRVARASVCRSSFTLGGSEGGAAVMAAVCEYT